MPRLSNLFTRFNLHSSPPSSSGGVGQRKRPWVQTGLMLSLALILLLTGSAMAQQSTGAIVGTVVDPTGAAVNGATITAKDVARGTVLTTQTNDTGAFNFPVAPVADYEVSVKAQGFQTSVRPKFTLTLNQTARLDFQLKVGQSTETVEVSAALPVLQTDTTLLGTIVDARTTEELPLSTHNINQLTLVTTPGVITPNLFGFQASQNTFGTGRPYVNGAREQENNFILDGMDNNQADNNDVGFVPAPDAVEEFNLITGNAPADFGNYLGGVVNVTLKSGTNNFHGSGYEFLRNDILNANSWQNNSACLGDGITCGKDQNGHEIAKRPGVRYDDFGGTFGGPIVKDKLFFFVDYSQSLFHQPKTPQALVTIPDVQRAGNFSSLCTAGFNASGICNNPTQQLFDPASSNNPATRTPFLNNQIPVGRFSPAAKAIVNSPFYPAGDVTNGLLNNSTNSYQGDAKIDYVPTDKDHIMGRWSQQQVDFTSTTSIVLLGNKDNTFPLKNGVVDWTRSLSSNLVNDARVGFSYFPVTEGFNNPTGKNLGQTFGIAGVATDFLPAMVFFNSTVGTFGTQDLVQSFHDTTLQFEDSLTWTHGNHVIHTGFEAYRYILNDLFPGTSGLAGQFTFSGQFTGSNGSSGGSAAADFLLGLPSTVGQGNGGGGNKYLRNGLYGAFVQDNWRMRSDLTFNLGLRYELTTARTTNNNQDVNFDRNTGNVTIGPGYATYKGKDNFQPRLGFAWQPKWVKNTVVRGAYGISTFMEANGVNNLPYQNPPFVEAHTADFVNLAQPGSTLDQGFSNFPANPCSVATILAINSTPANQQFSPATQTCLSAQTLHLTNPKLRPAVDQQWNLSVQYQLGKSTSVQVGYVGNKIDHMSDIFIYNQNFLNPNGTVTPGPFAQRLLNCCGVGNSPTIRYNDSSGIQRYNAMQVSLIQRPWQGVQYQLNYTWSKCLSNSLGYFGQFGDEEAPAGSISQTNSSFFFQNAYNPKGDYGRCIADAASLFNGYLVYDLPFGKGRQFGGSSNPVVNGFIGGWSIGSDFTLHTGFAINPSGPDNSGTGIIGASRPDCVSGVAQQGTGDISNIGGQIGIQFLNPFAVAAPKQGTFGNCPAGGFRGPGLKNADLNLSKQFSITEKTNLTLRAEFLNLTNTPIFGAPNANCGPVCNGQITDGQAGAGSFGRVTSSNPGRQVQIALRLKF
ncbi:MAG TPA: carboxypeptidase regulatory-like domain-containing protein [Candidatus Angelobacter sp.]|nr:carboxypeptidase regulatory-like domain-containing protein [Candidatus Angelobacter sp.]